MNIRFFFSKIFIGILCLAIIFTACKKANPIPDTAGTNNNNITPAARMQLTLDSIFLYAKETYLWYDALPSYAQFNPAKYTTASADLTNFQKELFDITQFKINSATGFPYEYVSSTAGYPKYSYIVNETVSSGKTSSVTLEGVGNDFGFALSSIGANDIRIRYVNPGSPAATAKIFRGYRLVKINGTVVRADSQADINLINSAFNLATMTLTLEKPDLTTMDVSLIQGKYNSSPVFKHTVLTGGTKKAGYIAFARFSNLASSQTDLDNAFIEFNAAGITNIIIDLRYNGGGYVETSQYLANLIAPPTINGSTMYIEYFNQLLANGQAPILSKQILYDTNNKPVFTKGRIATYADVDFSIKGNTYNFSKKGLLNTIKNVYFIVSGNTASASELLINNLKPYLNVKLIGSKTYGKPVGFFGLKIDKYTVFMSQFQSKNSAGTGDYFDGMPVDFTAADDVTRDFGDPAEAATAIALSLVKDGISSLSASTMSVHGVGAVSSASVEVKDVSADTGFEGMIENRLKLKE